MLQTVVVSKPSFDGLLRLDTVIRRLPHLPTDVSKLTINCSITFCAITIIYFVHCFHQIGVINTLSVVAVITCSFQSALPPSKTITF